MTRRLLLSLTLLALAGSGCTNESGIVTITGLYNAAALKCKTPKATDALFGGGTADYAVDPVSYYVGVILQANPSSGGNTGPLVVGGTVLETGNRDVPILDEKVLTYTVANRTALKIPEFHQPIFYRFDFGIALPSISNGAENLISTDVFATGKPQAAELIQTSGGGGPLDLRVHLEYRGHMSRSGGPLTTNAITAPLLLVQSTSCTVPRLPVFTDTGCPFLPQDGSLDRCCDTLPSPTAGCP